jgi:3-oxoacyl-[acyl-carrier-protein] synthase I
LRPVYSLGGDLAFAGGRGRAAAVEACRQSRPQPGELVLPRSDGEMRLPYHAIDDGLSPPERLRRVARDALAEAGLADAARQRCGVFVGTSSNDIGPQESAQAQARSRGEPVLMLPQPYQGKLAESLALDLGLSGPCVCFGTACSASANALLYATWMIREGLLDHAVVVGLEWRNQLTPLGFNSMLLVARDGCRPFDAKRNGIVLGEAVAVAVLGADKPDRAAWQLAGGATLCDVSHPTQPSATRIADTLRQALDDAGSSMSDISAIKAHGTGTPGNDLSEGHALRAVFGDVPPPFTSIKPLFGHTLGACGVVETLATLACLDAGFFPGTAGFLEPDAEIGLAPLTKSRELPRGPVLLNFFGFGGNNCCLVARPC